MFFSCELNKWTQTEFRKSILNREVDMSFSVLKQSLFPPVAAGCAPNQMLSSSPVCGETSQKCFCCFDSTPLRVLPQRRRKNGTRVMSVAPDGRGQRGLEQLPVDRELMRGPWVLCHSLYPEEGEAGSSGAKGPTWNNAAVFTHRSRQREETSPALELNQSARSFLPANQIGALIVKQPITDRLLERAAPPRSLQVRTDYWSNLTWDQVSVHTAPHLVQDWKL